MKREGIKKQFDRVLKCISGFWLRAKSGVKKLLACNEKTLRTEAKIATILYIFVLFWALFLKFNDREMLVQNYINLSQLTLRERFLYDIVPFCVRQNHLVQWLEFFANSLVFAPIGVLLHYLFEKSNIWRNLAICFALSVSFEILQLFTLLGGFATVDLIMNTLGYFVGFAFYRLIFSRLSLRTSVWVCRIFNLIFFSISVYAVISTVENLELIAAILTRSL